jgi:hypothetical protein
MKPSQKALQLRREAKGALRICDRVAAQDHPWTSGSLYAWQGVFCRASNARSKLLFRYLADRKERKHCGG